MHVNPERPLKDPHRLKNSSETAVIFKGMTPLTSSAKTSANCGSESLPSDIIFAFKSSLSKLHLL